ncbi:hypothetical protein [Hymenobacter radiodurans]|uniref:hypothetical protein n=1 Tax=Hymenobacter radiodurans TaxID=2496028 RepID=UPI001058D16C|nr:hypothetical protein [Hymenobacter radiodurans]
MNSEELETDKLLASLLPKTYRPAAPETLLPRVMEAVAAAQQRQAARLEPLIPRRVWRVIGASLAVLLLVDLGLGLLAIASWPAVGELFGHQLSLPSSLLAGEWATPSLLKQRLLVVAMICSTFLLLDKWHLLGKSRARHSS